MVKMVQMVYDGRSVSDGCQMVYDGPNVSSRGVDRKVFIVGFNFYRQQFLTVITRVRLGRFTV
jgi:hypothetical protein